MTTRRLEALRNLAERPGTEAEGKVAREMLNRAILSSGSPSISDLTASVVRDVFQRERIRREIRQRFPKGTRAYYNRWAFSKNQPCTVVGYAKDWDWVRVKFDNRKTAMAIPIIEEGRWNLSTEPLSDSDAEKLRRGMEKFEQEAQ